MHKMRNGNSLAEAVEGNRVMFHRFLIMSRCLGDRYSEVESGCVHQLMYVTGILFAAGNLLQI